MSTCTIRSLSAPTWTVSCGEFRRWIATGMSGENLIDEDSVAVPVLRGGVPSEVGRIPTHSRSARRPARPTPQRPVLVGGLEITSVIGIDPGPTTGIAFLDYYSTQEQPAQIEIFQMPAACVEHFLEAYLGYYYIRPEVTRKFAQVEKFVTGQSAGSRGKPAEVTRQAVMRDAELLEMAGYSVAVRSAAEVKPWATNKRLDKAGVVASLTSMVHGRDSARHGLYCAVRDAGRRDPLA
jgi:hypothetical protein